jgi:hypothetical protein
MAHHHDEHRPATQSANARPIPWLTPDERASPIARFTSASSRHAGGRCADARARSMVPSAGCRPRGGSHFGGLLGTHRHLLAPPAHGERESAGDGRRLPVRAAAGVLAEREERERTRRLESERRAERAAVVQGIAGLSSALGFRDEYTCAHSQHVARLAVDVSARSGCATTSSSAGRAHRRGASQGRATSRPPWQRRSCAPSTAPSRSPRSSYRTTNAPMAPATPGGSRATRSRSRHASSGLPTSSPRSPKHAQTNRRCGAIAHSNGCRASPGQSSTGRASRRCGKRSRRERPGPDRPCHPNRSVGAPPTDPQATSRRARCGSGRPGPESRPTMPRPRRSARKHRARTAGAVARASLSLELLRA